MTPTCRIPIRVIVHPYDIPVCYSDVRALVPRLYDAYSSEVDIWLHFGMRPNQDVYSVEQLGRRDGYHKHKDITGESLPVNHFFQGFPERLESTLDLDDIFARWRSKLLDSPEISPQLGGVRIRKSRDHGHFICDFLYYSMLAEHWKRKSGTVQDSRPMDQMPVLFMNVPTKNSLEQLQEARHVTIQLLQALAESWRSKKDMENSATGL
jgi:pyroglutamyl-peptidase